MKANKSAIRSRLTNEHLQATLRVATSNEVKPNIGLLLLLLFTRLLPRDGGMAEDHGAPEARQLPKIWTRSGKETESRQRVSGTKSP